MMNDQEQENLSGLEGSAYLACEPLKNKSDIEEHAYQLHLLNKRMCESFDEVFNIKKAASNTATDGLCKSTEKGN